MKQLLVFGLCLVSCSGALPSSFKKCNKKRGDFKQCFQVAVQDAIHQVTVPFKEIGLPILDPLEIPAVTVAPGNGPAAFDQKYQDMHILGISQCNCPNVFYEGDTLGADCTCPFFNTTFHYELDGKILVIPIKGQGKGFVDIVNPNCTLTFKLGDYKKKGKKYFKVVETNFVMKPEVMHFNYDRLFEGSDQNLSDNINKVFNENWRALYEDIGVNFEKVMANVLESIVGRVFDRVPIAELFGEE